MLKARLKVIGLAALGLFAESSPQSTSALGVPKIQPDPAPREMPC